jgi:hypothetical protein
MTREDEEEKTSSLDAAESSLPLRLVSFGSGHDGFGFTPPQRKKFGSDKEFNELMKQQMKFEDEMEDVRREVRCTWRSAEF